ncbi:MAG: zinc-dependent metalloprotease [Altibacter sp.]|uniref:T9SS type A sorting domain-containing protein n=1 Tax=Altibacter sp. TaxID=2024823 RepID=UPI001E153A86|nr:T9SS type A sorting domain-containing protein [Altibacter sp.]MBZ0326130.1 zinc-dependent metalloprotease [Altibacter sp.]
MKKLLSWGQCLVTLIIFFSAQSFLAKSEFDLCKTGGFSSHLPHLEAMRGLDHTNDIFYLKIYIHVLRKETEPKLGQSKEDINRQLKYLYDDFDPLGIHFVWDGNIDYIDNDEFFEDPDYYSNPGEFPNGTEPIFNTNNHSDGIDIYFFDIEEGNGGVIGGMFGRTDDIGGSAMILGGKFKGHHNGDEMIPSTWTKLISHEMGHILFLFHTFHGTTLDENENSGDPNACPEIVNPITDPNHPLYEQQVSNGWECGDYIPDTVANPGISWFALQYMEVDENCEYEAIPNPGDWISDYDINGDPFDPDPTNLMCYTYPTCYNGFTLGQKKRMKNAIWYLPVLNNTLLNSYTYIRPNIDCFVCFENNTHLYEVYSSIDIGLLSVTSSPNVQTQIIATSGNSFTARVTSMLDENVGEPGYFNIVNSLGTLATQSMWVGKPQAVPDASVNGPMEISGGQWGLHYKIIDGNLRLDGIDTYVWDYPQPNESHVFFGGLPPNNPIIWQYDYFSKYTPKSLSNGAGNDTGVVSVRGKNPCGVGSNGQFNELCVENLDDNDGEPDCSTPPGPIYYYPNPASSLLEVDLSLQEYQVYTVTIYDENQTVHYSDQSTNIVKTVDVAGLLNGTYYLHIYDDDATLILSAILIINH